MAGVWLSEVRLKEALGADDAHALLEALGGMTFYLPTRPQPTNILGRDLSKILSKEGYSKLVRLCGGDRISLPNFRRVSNVSEAKSLLRKGMSIREVADHLRISQRYAEKLSAEVKAQPQQLSLFS